MRHWNIATAVTAVSVALSLLYLFKRQLSKHTSHKKFPSRRRKREVVGSVNVHGLVNTANWCYLNSVVQSLASLESFRRYLHQIQHPSTSNTEPDVILPHANFQQPLTEALKYTIDLLTCETKKEQVIYPSQLLSALEDRAGGPLSRQQQDAHELFQTITSGINEETALIGKIPLFHLQSITDEYPPFRFGVAERCIVASRSPKTERKQQHPLRSLPKFPLQGLIATKVTCGQCNYTSDSSIKHCFFDHLPLTVPNRSFSTLEDCLSSWSQPERIEGFRCRKCSLKATLAKLDQDLGRLTEQIKSTKRKSTKKVGTNKSQALFSRLIDWKNQLEQALAENIEAALTGIPILKTTTPIATLQSMIARKPPVLAMHLSRSVYSGGAHKNNGSVSIPLRLDVRRFCTEGLNVGIHDIVDSRSSTKSEPLTPPVEKLPLQGTGRSNPETRTPDATEDSLYNLAAIICHHGSHENGHFVAYCRRRKTAPDGTPAKKRRTTADVDEGRNRSEKDLETIPILVEQEQVEEKKEAEPPFLWYRISDGSVEVVENMEEILGGGAGSLKTRFFMGERPSTPASRGAYMVFYEKQSTERP